MPKFLSKPQCMSPVMRMTMSPFGLISGFSWIGPVLTGAPVSLGWVVTMTGVPDGTLFLGSRSLEHPPINSEHANINAAKDFFLMVLSNFRIFMSDIITLFL